MKGLVTYLSCSRRKNKKPKTVNLISKRETQTILRYKAMLQIFLFHFLAVVTTFVVAAAAAAARAGGSATG